MAGLEAVVVAKAATALPLLEVPVWTEPDEPSHPLTGLVYALERAGGRPVVAAACDMPFVGCGLLRRLAAAGGAAAARADHPFPGRYEPSALPALRDGAGPRSARARGARRAGAGRAGRAAWAALLGVNTPGGARRRPPLGLRAHAALRRAVDRGLRGRARAPGAERGGARCGAQARLRRRARLRAPRRADRVLAGRPAELSLDEALVLAQELSGGPDVPRP